MCNTNTNSIIVLINMSKKVIKFWLYLNSKQSYDFLG